MKTIINTIAGTLVFFFFFSMAGSANDCDGACMATANTLGEMLTIAGVGAVMMFVGGVILYKNSEEA